MRTSKDISNITYNSVAFLKGKLDFLVSKQVIEFYAFIYHHAEFQEDFQANKKPHIHFMVRPAKMIQTMELNKSLWEFVPGNDKPLKPTDNWHIVNSWADWYLYSIHHKYYLDCKQLEREFHYSIEDVVTSDRDTLDRFVSFIDLGDVFRKDLIFRYAEAGFSFSKAMADGIFGDKPQAYALLYKALLNDHFLKKQGKELI